MIIQVKSSYSDASSHVLEENQELYICHAPGTLADEKHAYIQKVADAYAVARMYLEHGKLQDFVRRVLIWKRQKKECWMLLSDILKQN